MKAVLLLSKTFLPPHPNAGQPTWFAKKVICGQKLRNNRKDIDCLFPFCGCCGVSRYSEKIHTCRANYEYWKKKIDKLKDEGGVLSVRQWHGIPFCSRQETIIDIPAEYTGVQKLTLFIGNKEGEPYCLIDGKHELYADVAGNDGLSESDFTGWFKPVFEREQKEVLDFAIIHFTEFRY